MSQLDDFASVLLPQTGWKPLSARMGSEMVSMWGEAIRTQPALPAWAQISRFLQGQSPGTTRRNVIEAFQLLDRAVAAFRTRTDELKTQNGAPWQTVGGGDRILPIVLSVYTSLPASTGRWNGALAANPDDPSRWPWDEIAGVYMDQVRPMRPTLLDASKAQNALDADTFFNGLIRRKVHFRDLAAGYGHGAYTHQVQWWLICCAGFLERPWDAFVAISTVRAQTDWMRLHGEQTEVGITVWDALFDRDLSYGHSSNWFWSEDNSLDFRSPQLAHGLLVRPARFQPGGTVANRNYMMGKAPKLSAELTAYLDRQIAASGVQGTVVEGTGGNRKASETASQRAMIARRVFNLPLAALSPEQRRWLEDLPGLVSEEELRRPSVDLP